MATPHLRVEITGDRALVATLARFGAEGPRALAGALSRQAERIMTESKRRVPVDTGALRASGTVASPEVRGSEVSVTLGYGGPAVSYAIPVHEDLTARHPVGEAKYLERPLLEASRTLAADLAADLARALTRMGR